MRVHWLTPRVALSGCVRYREDMAALAEMGVTHLLAFFSDDDRCWETNPKVELAWAAEFGVEVYRINRADDAVPWPQELMRGALEYARTALATPGTRLLVHCMAGLCRSPVMAYGVLRHVFAMEREEARRLIEPLLAPDRTTLHEVYQASMEAHLLDGAEGRPAGASGPEGEEDVRGQGCATPSSIEVTISSPESRAGRS